MLFRFAKHQTKDYKSTKDRVDQVRSVNESIIWYNAKASNAVPRLIIVTTSTEGEVSVTSISSADAKEKKVNEILAVFIDLLFAHLIFEADVKMM